MFSFKDNQFMQKESLKKQLQVLIDEANSKDDNELDIILFRKIDAIRSCMIHMGVIDDEVINLLKNIKGCCQYFKIICINNNNQKSQLIKNNDIILEKSFQLYDYYQNVECHYNKRNVNQRGLEKATYEFLEMMGCMHLYEEIKNNNMILRTSNIDFDRAWCVDNYGLSYIILSDVSKNNSFYYTGFIHEMGHAFANYILKDEEDWKCNRSIYSEIISYTFERVFHQFIYDNSFLSIDELNKIVAHFEACNVNQLYYGIGTSQIVQSKQYRIDDDRVLPSAYWFKKLKTKSVFSEIENINKYGYWISMLTYLYIIGNMGSIKLAMDYKRNNKDFISKLPETIMDVSTIPTNDLIEKYCSVSDFEPFFVNNFYDYKVKKK